MTQRLRKRLPVLLVLLALAVLPALPASGAELTAFAMGGKPGEVWGTGYGGMLTITLFTFANGELEGAWQGGAIPETSIVSGSAKAYLGIPLGPFVPYGGIGVGVYRESLPTLTDQGTSGMVFAGAKLKFPFGLVVRGEYQWLDMPDEVRQPLDNRYLFGVGLSF
jgi:opacity protein-like surface antigen